MTNNRHQYLLKLKAFRKASQELTAAWNELDSDADELTPANYPFSKSFDEVALEISMWESSVNTKFKLLDDFDKKQ